MGWPAWASPLGWFAAAFAVQGALALAGPAPVDWDPSYYRALAADLAAGGDGASWVVWNLSWLPDALPYPSDVHWMPLPSRVLVPGLWLWPAGGDRLTSVLLGALLAPIAWWLARDLSRDAWAPTLAAGLATLGGLYGWMLSVPDSIAVYGAIGGAAFLAASQARFGWVAALGALAGLTRNDGFLLAPCLALAAPTLPVALGVAASGPLAAAGWHLRNLTLLGDGYVALRAATARALDGADFLAGTAVDSPPLTRLLAALNAMLQGAPLLWAAYLPLPALPAALAWRRTPWVGAWLAYALALPVVPALLAPGVVASGAVFRSGAALFAPGCALAAVGLCQLCQRAAQARGYPAWFVPALGIGALAWVGAAAGPAQYLRFVATASDPCVALGDVPTDAVVLSANPLLVRARCGHPGVVVVPGADAAQLNALAARYGAQYALIDAPADEGPWLGWAQVSPGVLRKDAP